MIRIRIACASFLAAALLANALAVPAQAIGEQSIARGRTIVGQYCAGCHGQEAPSGVAIDGVAVPSFREVANRSYQSPEQLQDFLLTPYRRMPAIPLALTEIRDVSAYIMSLGQ